MDQVAAFNEFRARMNGRILDADSKLLKRMFNLDSQAYQPGVLSGETKELIGLACSLVLRCDDCVRYHLQAARQAGVGAAAIQEAFEIALLIGGTIVIPHLRRAFAFLDELDDSASPAASAG